MDTGKSLRQVLRERPLLKVSLFLLFSLLVLRVYLSFAYPIHYQHDPGEHITILQEALRLHAARDYNAPFYYFISAFISSPLIVLGGITGWAALADVQAVAGFFNFVYYALFLLVNYFFARALLFSRENSLLYTVICGSIPALNRGFSMVRPDNMLAVLAPAAAAAMIRLVNSQDGRLKHSVLLSALCALTIGQKISGVIIVLPLFLIGLLAMKGALAARLKKLLVPALLTVLFAGVLVALHVKVSHHTPFDNHVINSEEYSHKPGMDVFLRFNPAALWDKPTRNNHGNSFWGIYFADLFADYWGYGYSSPAFNMPWEVRLFKARSGLLLSSFFIFLFLAGLALGRTDGSVREKALLRMYFLIPVPATFAFMIFVSFRNMYNPGEFDILKWEYIPWVIPLFALPALHALETGSAGTRKALGISSVILAVSGILQSIVIRF